MYVCMYVCMYVYTHTLIDLFKKIKSNIVD